VPVAELAQPLHELGRRHVEATFTLHRLEQDRGDARGLDVALEEGLQALERLLHAHAVQRVRERGVKHVGREGAETRLVRIHLAGQRERHERAPVKAAAEGDHSRPAGGGARDLDRVLDRLGPGRHQQGLVRARSRGERVQPLAQGDVRLIAGDLETGVGDAVELRARSLDHARVTVARIEHADAAGEIHETAAGDVPQQRVLGTVDEHGMGHRDAAGDRGLAPGEQGFVGVHVGFLTDNILL
jgi:hypothetical protein